MVMQEPSSTRRRRIDPKTLLKNDHEGLSNSQANCPDGYVFVPKGDVYITRHCRELTQRSGKTLFLVYNSKTNTQIGLHCPKEVFEEVNANAAATALSRKQNVLVRDQRDQVNARSAILRLYPGIPLQDVHIILGHGFAKGTGRVGRTGTLSMDEKVTMAVAAHVRHTHTSYDSILLGQDRRKGTKDGRRKEARAQIRKDQDAVLDSWRGSKAAGNPKLTRELGPAPALKRINSNTGHRAISTATTMVAPGTRKRHRTVNVTQETQPTSKQPKRQATVEAKATISHNQRCVNRESSEGLSEEFVHLLSDDNDDDERSISAATQSPPNSVPVKPKTTIAASPKSWVKTRKTIEQSKRGIDRTRKHWRGVGQQMETAEDSSARANALDAMPDTVMIEDNHGDKYFPRRKWDERSQTVEHDDDSIVLFEWPVLKPPERIKCAGIGAAKYKLRINSTAGHKR